MIKQLQNLKTGLALGLIALAAAACQAETSTADNNAGKDAGNDAKIENAAKKTYVFKTYLKGDDVSVKSADGAVVLTGTVEEASHKTLAEDTVAELPGVKMVDNQLKVKNESPGEKSDAWIAAQVKTALLFHRNVGGMDTEVAVKDGVVTLAGKADSSAQKQLTEEYAKDIDGVKEVRNEMTVEAAPVKDVPKTDVPADRQASLGQAIDDASITAQAKLALLTHRSTSATRTKVTTRDGVVTLSGEAKNGAEKDLVSKLVADIDGVRGVENAMTLQTN